MRSLANILGIDRDELQRRISDFDPDKFADSNFNWEVVVEKVAGPNPADPQTVAWFHATRVPPRARCLMTKFSRLISYSIIFGNFWGSLRRNG